MAYYDPTEEDQLDPNAPQQQVQTGPQSGVISGQGSSPSAGSPAPKPTNAPDKPGNFVGIQQYLEQNKPQSAKLAQDVGNFVTDQGVKAQGALDAGQNNFNQAVDQNTVTLNEDLFKQAKESPQEVAADQAKKAEFQKMRDAQYKGPSSLEGSDYYQPISLAVQNALGTAGKTSSTEGRSSLLADIQKQNKQKVSRGAANLDSALLSVSPDSKNILSQARDSINPLDQKLKDSAAADALKASQAADQTAKTQKAIQDAFAGPTGVQGQLESSLRSRADQAAKQAGMDTDAIMDLLRTGNKSISNAQLKLLGLTRGQYDGLINDQKYYKDKNKSTTLNDLTSFATKQPPLNQITPQNIANDTEYARYAALNDLMGTSNGFLSDPSLAGKANFDTLDFNYGSTPNALGDRINDLRVDRQFDTMTPSTFSDINKLYNLNTNPAGLAHQAIVLAQQLGKGDSTAEIDNTLPKLQAKLNEINSSYDTNLRVPDSYIKKAEQEIKGNMDSVYSAYPSPYKKIPSNQNINQIAQIAAYTTFLNELSKDSSKVRAGAPTPPPGQFTL